MTHNRPVGSYCVCKYAPNGKKGGCYGNQTIFLAVSRNHFQTQTTLPYTVTFYGALYLVNSKFAVNIDMYTDRMALGFLSLAFLRRFFIT